MTQQGRIVSQRPMEEQGSASDSCPKEHIRSGVELQSVVGQGPLQRSTVVLWGAQMRLTVRMPVRPQRPKRSREITRLGISVCVPLSGGSSKCARATRAGHTLEAGVRQVP